MHCLRDTRVTDSNGDLDSNTNEEISEMTSRFLERVKSVIWKRRIIEIEPIKDFQGPLFGLAPRETQAEDIVCILFGCSVPVILRKVKQSPARKTTGSSKAQEDSQKELSRQDSDEHSEQQTLDFYELIGEAYVHGKMDGEAVQDRRLVTQLSHEYLLQ